MLKSEKTKLKPKMTKEGKYQCPYDNKEYDTMGAVEKCIEKHIAKIIPG